MDDRSLETLQVQLVDIERPLNIPGRFFDVKSLVAVSYKDCGSPALRFSDDVFYVMGHIEIFMDPVSWTVVDLHDIFDDDAMEY